MASLSSTTNPQHVHRSQEMVASTESTLLCEKKPVLDWEMPDLWMKNITAKKVKTGWWFGTFFIFPYIGCLIIPIDFHIFQRGGPTTNQKTSTQFGYFPWLVTLDGSFVDPLRHFACSETLIIPPAELGSEPTQAHPKVC